MKNAILEESNMAGVNLRVGTLKYANLQNCTLRFEFYSVFNIQPAQSNLSMYFRLFYRGAVLAGADLEVSKRR